MADLISTQTIAALSFVAALLIASVIAAKTFLPKNATTKTKSIYTWLAFDALTHFITEGSFLYYSLNGRTVNSTSTFLAYLWQDYARADARWGFADPTVVSLEILTVLGCGPIAAYCTYLIAKNDSSYHFWVVVLSVAELYGGFMTFCPEWLTGNKYLNGSNFLLLYVYLYTLNLAWVFIPFYLIYDSYNAIVKGLKTTGARPISLKKGSSKKAR